MEDTLIRDLDTLGVQDEIDFSVDVSILEESNAFNYVSLQKEYKTLLGWNDARKTKIIKVEGSIIYSLTYYGDPVDPLLYEKDSKIKISLIFTFDNTEQLHYIKGIGKEGNWSSVHINLQTRWLHEIKGLPEIDFTDGVVCSKILQTLEKYKGTESLLKDILK